MRFHMNFNLINKFETNAFNAYHHELAGTLSTFAVFVTKNLRRAHAFQFDSQHNVLDDCVLYLPFLRMATDPAVKNCFEMGTQATSHIKSNHSEARAQPKQHRFREHHN